jgi:hypothetical protein
VAEGVAGLLLLVAGVVDGASFSLVGLHAVSVPMATNAVPPAAIAIRRLQRPVLMRCPVCRFAQF